MTVLGRLGKHTVVSVKVSPERLITSEYRWQQSLSEGLGWDKKRAQEYSSRCFLFPVSHDLSGLSPRSFYHAPSHHKLTTQEAKDYRLKLLKL